MDSEMSRLETWRAELLASGDEAGAAAVQEQIDAIVAELEGRRTRLLVWKDLLHADEKPPLGDPP